MVRFLPSLFHKQNFYIATILVCGLLAKSKYVSALPFAPKNIDSTEAFINYTDSVKLVNKLFPNPANSYIVFDFDKSIGTKSHLLIYSFTGNKMADIIISNIRTQVNLSDYFRGLYLYQIISPKGKILESGKFQVIK